MLTVSIIITTYNRCQDLNKVLEDMMNQETNKRFLFEVIIVDNNSNDKTKETVNFYVEKFDAVQMKGKCLGLRYYFEAKQGKSYALNHGIRESKGEILAFTDDDVRVDPHWIKNTMACFDQYACDGIGGRVVPIYPKETPQWIQENPQQLAGIVVIADYGEDSRPYGKPMDPFIGANYTFKRSVFDDCGLFREDLGPGAKAMGEDTEFVTRLYNAQKSLYYCGNAVIRHPVDLKRLKMKYIKPWHIALGRFAARTEMDDQTQKFVYIFGVPRYLWVGIVRDGLMLMGSIFNRLKYFNCLRKIFRKSGMIMEYRERSKRDAVEGSQSYG